MNLEFVLKNKGFISEYQKYQITLPEEISSFGGILTLKMYQELQL